MAFVMSHTTPATGAVAFYTALLLWVSAGCTVSKSGDGLALFSSTTNILTSGASGAGGLGNTNAWFVIQLGGGEEWCIQRGGTNQAWRIKVSRAAGFIGGTPSATRVPSATDEQVLLGFGTDAAPSGTTILANDGTFYLSIGIDTTAPRRLWWEGYAISGSALNSMIFRDVLVPTEPSDADVYVRGVVGGGTITSSTLVGVTNGSATVLPYYMGYIPSAAPTVVRHMPLTLSAANTTPTFPGNTGTLSISGKDPLLVPRYQRYASLGATVCMKGKSTLFAFCGVTRANGDRFTVATANDRVGFALLTTPWDNTVVPL
jgi:hypothetical protein